MVRVNNSFQQKRAALRGPERSVRGSNHFLHRDRKTKSNRGEGMAKAPAALSCLRAGILPRILSLRRPSPRDMIREGKGRGSPWQAKHRETTRWCNRSAPPHPPLPRSDQPPTPSVLGVAVRVDGGWASPGLSSASSLAAHLFVQQGSSRAGGRSRVCADAGCGQGDGKLGVPRLASRCSRSGRLRSGGVPFGASPCGPYRRPGPRYLCYLAAAPGRAGGSPVAIVLWGGNVC